MSVSAVSVIPLRAVRSVRFGSDVLCGLDVVLLAVEIPIWSVLSLVIAVGREVDVVVTVGDLAAIVVSVAGDDGGSLDSSVSYEIVICHVNVSAADVEHWACVPVCFICRVGSWALRVGDLSGWASEVSCTVDGLVSLLSVVVGSVVTSHAVVLSCDGDCCSGMSASAVGLV